ncbi:MAG: VWA domain-containing protein [Chloroflexota bacterium]
MSWSRWLLRVVPPGAALALVVGPLAANPAALAQGSPAPAATSLPGLPGPAPECVAGSEPDDQPEQAPSMSGPVCLTGTLPQLRDQDLVLWDVSPADALATWRITVMGIPTTITSVHLFEVRSAPGTFPVDAREFERIDSDAGSDTPGAASGVSLAAGHYLLGISRGDPAAGPPAPVGEYRVSIEREEALPTDGDLEPNDDATTATQLAEHVDLVGAVDGGPDVYRWTLDSAAASRRHRIDLRVVPGDSLDLRLLAPDGTELARATTGRDGWAHLHDLALPAGDHLLALSTGSGGAHGYRLSAVIEDDALADPEPNDDASRPVGIALGDEVTGRLAGPRDVDRYTFEAPPPPAASQQDVTLRVGSAHDRRLCLFGPDGREVQCRQGTGDLVLSNLALVEGTHAVVIDGDEDLEDHYRLSVTDVGPRTPDREVEPNDTSTTASPFDPGVTMRGRSANGDPDHYVITTTGAPQLWRLEATGQAIRSLLWLEPDGELLGTADVSADGTHAGLWDMWLIPGRHWVSIQTEGDDYALTLTPLGPVAEGQEREPNETLDDAEPIDVGVTRTGRLPTASDTDVVRFSLETAEHVVIRVDPPADGGVRLQLTSGGTELLRVRQPVAGQPFVHEAWLELGDYELTLQGAPASLGPYRLSIQRGDPWALPADLEPNDTPETARDLPASLQVRGGGFGEGREDTDWFRIPIVPDAAQALVVTTVGDVDEVQLWDGTSTIYLDPDATRGTWTSRPLPATAGPLFLHVASGGDYELGVSGAGLVPSGGTADLPVQAGLATDHPEVSAYETFGQTVQAMLALANESAGDLTLHLEGRTSDDRWSVSVPAQPLVVGPGATVEVPVSVTVPPDAWADVPTRVWVRMTDAEGRSASVWLDVTPGRDAPPVAPSQAWPIPDQLLGGLDVASTALGAGVVQPRFNPASEESLHDGLAVMGAGFIGSIAAGQPAVFTMDLATDEPVPVAGIVIDPLAGDPARVASPRAFELELSADGATWRTALAGELTPRMADQPFVLPQPVDARFARLTIRSTWGGDHATLQLGEWQVIATPGWAPPGPINVADPRNGGHVVTASSNLTDPRQGEATLSEDLETAPWTPYLEPGTQFSWVVGFRDGRAAQVTELQWVDAAGDDPTQRFASVRVELSDESPLGPWQDAGVWELARAEEGRVAPFRLAAPAWARYVRLTADGPTERKEYRALPVVLRVIERPTDATYRSITGAWGRTSRAAIQELSLPPDLAALASRRSEADGNDHPASATALVEGVAVDADVQRGLDVDWYTLTVPPTDNTLTLDIEAPPVAGVTVTLTDLAGQDVPLAEVRSSSPTVARYAADVEPGATYRVRVDQPPFSTVFTYDTSGSLGAVLGYVSTAVRGFAADVRAGEESVQVMPFEDTPLLPDWSDDRWLIEDAVAGVTGALGSSAAETSMIAGAKELASRPGARAMLVVTDAETMSYHQTSSLWASLADVRPVVFTVHVGGGGAPALGTNLMEDWANAWGGHYEYAASHAQLDRAFDRLATWLRRPATYRIAYDATFVDHTPGQLSLESRAGPDAASSVVAGSGVGVEILLDTSGSMRAKVGRSTRIAIAKRVLHRLVSRTLPEGLPVGLRTFDPARRCGSTLVAPIEPLDRDQMLATIKGLKVVRQTRTPIAATLQQVASDLARSQGPAIVVLVTDGAETCQGDPEAVIRELAASGLDIRLNIVGFAIDDEGLREQLARWAELGGGEAFTADDADSLTAGIAAALAAPFRVLDAAGVEVATGTVGGDPVSLPPGTYSVEVLTDPVRVYEAVVIAPGGWRRLQVGDPVTSDDASAPPAGVSQ